jgi:signal transduction histidine kinase
MNHRQLGIFSAALSLLVFSRAALATTVDQLDAEGVGFMKSGIRSLAERNWRQEKTLADRQHNKKGSLRARIRLASLDPSNYAPLNLKKMVDKAREQGDACLEVLALQNLASQSSEPNAKLIKKQIQKKLPSVGKDCIGESPDVIDVMIHNPADGFDASVRALIDFVARFAPGGDGYTYSPYAVSKLLFGVGLLFAVLLVLILIGVIWRFSRVRIVEREKLRKSVIERLNEGVLGVSKEGTVVFANGTAARFSMRQPLVGVAVQELITLESGKPLEIASNLGTFIGFAQRKGESPLPCEVTVSKNNVWGGLAYVIVYRDITERLEAERSQSTLLRELKNTNELLDAYARMTAHDLKIPLTGIHAYCEALSEDYQLEDTEMKSLIGKIKEESMRSIDYIQGLLDYARSTDINLIPEQVNILIVLREIWQSLNPPDSIRLDTAAFEVCIVTLPEYGIRQVFQNLLSNAIKYRDKGKNISTVKVEAISVRNDIEEYLDKIFEIGFKIGNRKDSDGFGLGQVMTLVQRMRGSIRVESELGIGSTFILVFKNCLKKGVDIDV